jgi:hypothetical protein
MSQEPTPVTPASGSGRAASEANDCDGVIILTGGLTGSSVLAGLLGAVGFWTGNDTFEKRDYNTHENASLIRLNRDLMARVGVGEEYTKYFLPDAIDAIDGLEVQDGSRFAEFIAECHAHRPWLWKEPRLWLTIRFWDRYLPATGLRFLLLERDLLQAWISMTQRRTIQTWEYTKRYHEGVQSSLKQYLSRSGRPFLTVNYEDLIIRPEAELERLSRFLGRPVSMQHLTSTYRGRLYRKNKGFRDAVEAALIYTKNFRERLR